MMRAQARLLVEGTIGWITVKGNAGTPFLLEAEKPYYPMVLPTSPETDFEASKTFRTMLAKDWLVPDVRPDNPREEHAH